MAPTDDDTDAVFLPDADRFVPTEHAVSPWGGDRLHGGPVLGLLTRAFENAAGAGLRPTRLTFDLFRPVPRAPLAIRVEPLRHSGRLQLLSAGVFADAVEVARASALYLRGAPGLSSGASEQDAATRPPGPAGIETVPLVRDRAEAANMPRGFHNVVETRWLTQRDDRRFGIWFRLPIALVHTETPSALQCAAALSDFCNAVASISARAKRQQSPPYINTDTTLYLSRLPEGEWFCLLQERAQDCAGIGLSQFALHDRSGCFGRSLQARLANEWR